MINSILLAESLPVQTWTYILVGITFTLYIGIAIWARAGSTKEFYVAGGGVSPLANGMATAADWMSAASFISMAGIISFAGYDGAVYLMGWTGGYVLLALLLAPYLRKFGKFTVPDFIGDRYYSNTARLVGVICALLVSFTYVAGQMRGVGLVFSRFLEVDINTGVIIGMIIVLFYAVLGGMKGITYTQVAQYCVLIFAFMVPAIFISIQMTGNPIPQLGFGGMDEGGVYLLDKLDGLHKELGFAEYTSGSKSTLDIFFITAAAQAGAAPLCSGAGRLYYCCALGLFVRSGQYGAYAIHNNSYFQWFNSVFVGIFYIFLPAIHSDGCFALDGAGQSCVIGLIAIAPCALVRRSSAVCGC